MNTMKFNERLWIAWVTGECKLESDFAELVVKYVEDNKVRLEITLPREHVYRLLEVIKLLEDK